MYVCMYVYAGAAPKAMWRVQDVDAAYADVCWRMLTYADVCWRMLTYADVC